MSARHLYVHVPFCARRCTYCDFSIAVRPRVPADEYLGALEREIARTALPAELDTIYLGGGTPSRLGAEGIARLARTLGLPRPLAEFTLEANPEDVTADAARAWAAAGVTRLSIGAQSFDDRVLAWMHRTHTAQAIPAAVRAAREAGIGSLSLDVIFALPGVLGRDLERDLSCAVACEPDHVSLYGLTVEPGTPLAHQIERGDAAPAPEPRYEEEYLLAQEALERAGYRFYEVSNAARTGHQAVHNRAYWRLVPYLGLGPSAHSFDGTVRWWNEAAYARWVRLLGWDQSPVAGREILSPAQRELERRYLSLRTAEGMELSEPCPAPLDANVRRWVAQGWAKVVPGGPGGMARRVRLTPRGWLRLDALVASI